MSAVVCGKRSSFFEELPSSPPVSKRIRCSSSSPVRLSPPRSSLLDHLTALFPGMEKQLLERALEESGDDLDSAIRSLHELSLRSVENLGSAVGKSVSPQDVNVQLTTQGLPSTTVDVAAAKVSLAPENMPMNGAEWVEFFVREMISAANMDDARARASKALEVLEKSICANTTAQVTQKFQQEKIMLTEQLEALIHENAILKRAVAIQHERQKEFDDRTHELHHMKQLVSQYQEQLRTLEVNNYALKMHLKQAQQNNSIAGHFHPDVF